jgi:acyl-CoA synthetase (AMP-forming)/AMP-acid ligase II
MYGQTEATARLSFLPPERLRDKLGSIGKGLPSTRLEVLKRDGAPVRPGSNETGEIVASGGNIAAGYWNDPVETATFFKQGKLHTGDLAKIDEDGFIYFVERERDMIKPGGNRVSAREVEEVLSELPEVVEAAVVGVPHAWWGEAIVGFIVARPGFPLSREQLEKHCRQRLPAFKMPQHFQFLDALPHNAAGKVQKTKLRQLAAVLERNTAAPLGRNPSSCAFMKTL